MYGEKTHNVGIEYFTKKNKSKQFKQAESNLFVKQKLKNYGKRVQTMS